MSGGVEALASEAVATLLASRSDAASAALALSVLRHTLELEPTDEGLERLGARLAAAAAERGHFAVVGACGRVFAALRGGAAAGSEGAAQGAPSGVECDAAEAGVRLLLGYAPADPPAAAPASQHRWSRALAQAALGAAADAQAEIAAAAAALAAQTADLLRPSGEVLLLFAPTPAAVAWLLHAHRRQGRRFELIVCETEVDALSGHEAASALAAAPPAKAASALGKQQAAKGGAGGGGGAGAGKGGRIGGAQAVSAADAGAAATAAAAAGIAVTLIPDTAAWACMPRVSRVVLCCAAVSEAAVGEDRAALCSAGARAVALAAHAHAVPVLALASSFALLPVPRASLEAAAALHVADPAAALGLSRARAAVAGIDEVCSPKFEVLGAGEVDLIVTDAGVERL